MCPQGFVAYELKGESLDAAIELDLRVRAALSTKPVATTGRSLLDVHNDYRRQYNAVLDEIRRDDPALAARCGLSAPVTQVEAQDGAHPRAYHVYPEIFGTSAKMPMYLMFCPVNYKGDHFKPADAVAVDDKDMSGTDMGHTIYKNLFWVADGPVIDAGKNGVAMPHDFNPATATTIPGQGLRPDRCFRAGGDALYTLDRMEQEKELFNRTWKAFSDGVQQWARKTAPDNYCNMSLRTVNGANVLEISLRGRGGTPVPLKSPDWIINKQLSRDWYNPVTGDKEHVILQEYEVEPNTATEEGRKLYMLLKAVPLSPSAQAYPDIEVTSSKGTHKPVVHRFPQGIYLAVHGVPDDEKVIAPRGCIGAPAAELIWLDRDRRDREWGITPPPPPAALAHLYKAAQPPVPRTPQP